MKKDPGLPKLNIFIDGWDFSRFVYMVENMDPSEFPNHVDISPALSRCRAMSNEFSHEDHSGLDKIGKNDIELKVLIMEAHDYIPQVNGLGRRESQQLKERLKELQGFLFYDEHSEVPSFSTRINNRMNGVKQGNNETHFVLGKVMYSAILSEC